MKISFVRPRQASQCCATVIKPVVKNAPKTCSICLDSEDTTKCCTTCKDSHYCASCVKNFVVQNGEVDDASGKLVYSCPTCRGSINVPAHALEHADVQEKIFNVFYNEKIEQDRRVEAQTMVLNYPWLAARMFLPLGEDGEIPFYSLTAPRRRLRRRRRR